MVDVHVGPPRELRFECPLCGVMKDNPVLNYNVVTLANVSLKCYAKKRDRLSQLRPDLPGIFKILMWIRTLDEVVVLASHSGLVLNRRDVHDHIFKHTAVSSWSSQDEKIRLEWKPVSAYLDQFPFAYRCPVLLPERKMSVFS